MSTSEEWRVLWTSICYHDNCHPRWLMWVTWWWGSGVLLWLMGVWWCKPKGGVLIRRGCMTERWIPLKGNSIRRFCFKFPFGSFRFSDTIPWCRVVVSDIGWWNLDEVGWEESWCQRGKGKGMTRPLFPLLVHKLCRQKREGLKTFPFHHIHNNIFPHEIMGIWMIFKSSLAPSQTRSAYMGRGPRIHFFMIFLSWEGSAYTFWDLPTNRNSEMNKKMLLIPVQFIKTDNRKTNWYLIQIIILWYIIPLVSETFAHPSRDPL